MEVGRKGMKRGEGAGIEERLNSDHYAKFSFNTRRKKALPWQCNCVLRFAPFPVCALKLNFSQH